MLYFEIKMNKFSSTYRESKGSKLILIGTIEFHKYSAEQFNNTYLESFDFFLLIILLIYSLLHFAYTIISISRYEISIVYVGIL